MTQRDEGHNYRDSKNRAMEYERNKKVDEQAYTIIDLFTQYLSDFELTLEEFFKDGELTTKGNHLLKDIKKILKK
jgi:hypothetical protein